MDEQAETEAVARAIWQVREQNGGPPYDAFDAIYGERQARKLRESIFEEARAAIKAVRAFQQNGKTDGNQA